MPDVQQHSAVRRFGAFEINLQSGELRKNGLRLRLSGQPFQVLAHLIESAGELVTREELRSKLWPADTFVDFDHGLNNAVARIREVLEDSSGTPRYIETIPRRGYRFIAPVSVPSNNNSVTAPASSAANGEVNFTSSSVSIAASRGKSAFTLLKPLVGTVAVLALVVVAGIWYRVRSAKAAAQPAIRSVAVLPLKNLSGDPTQEYLADAMTEGVIGRLSRIRYLRVVSRTSVMGFKDTPLPIPKIAKALGADAIVEGSLIREGNHIRVHAQLIRAVSDEHFWAQEYDREVENVLALQSDIAQSIAEKVEATVTGQERLQLVATRPVAPEVYESYLKGKYVPGFSRAAVEKSISYFQEAIQKDPTFAPAYVDLAGAYYGLGTVIVGGPPQQTRPQVINAAQKALELDPSLVIPHVLLGYVYQARWQWKDAENEFKRALELGPNDAAAHHGYARWLLSYGRIDEALAWQQRARQLDPLGNDGEVGWILFHARRYNEAIRELRMELQANPDSGWAQWVLSFALICNGQPDEAIPIMEKLVPQSERSPGNVQLLATAYARAGNRTKAQRLVEELKQRRRKGYIPAAAFIHAYLALGEYDEAFFWFGEAYKEQSQILQFLKVHPFFDPVRGDPRFADLQRKVGLN
jgi:TolB-like protein/DNA-binding winged helix-turn-helix (wHTH) protein/Tfp pilus assembly protein PilF